MMVTACFVVLSERRPSSRRKQSFFQRECVRWSLPALFSFGKTRKTEEWFQRPLRLLKDALATAHSVLRVTATQESVAATANLR